MKISQGLMQKRIPDSLIHHALSTIDEEEYRDTLSKALLKKKELLNIEDGFKLKQKLLAFATSRGFEPDLIWDVLNEMSL